MAKINIQEVSGEVSLKEMSRENRRNHEVEKIPFGITGMKLLRNMSQKQL